MRSKTNERAGARRKKPPKRKETHVPEITTITKRKAKTRMNCLPSSVLCFAFFSVFRPPSPSVLLLRPTAVFASSCSYVLRSFLYLFHKVYVVMITTTSESGTCGLVRTQQKSGPMAPSPSFPCPIPHAPTTLPTALFRDTYSISFLHPGCFIFSSFLPLHFCFACLLVCVSFFLNKFDVLLFRCCASSRLWCPFYYIIGPSLSSAPVPSFSRAHASLNSIKIEIRK